MKQYIDIDYAYEIVFDDIKPAIIVHLSGLDEHEKTVFKSRLELLVDKFNKEFSKEVYAMEVK